MAKNENNRTKNGGKPKMIEKVFWYVKKTDISGQLPCNFSEGPYESEEKANERLREISNLSGVPITSDMNGLESVNTPNAIFWVYGEIEWVENNNT